MPVAKAGARAQLLIESPARPATVDAALVTVIMIVLLVTPSCAVITVVMVFAPTFNAIGCDNAPELAALPFTMMVAVGSVAVGVTCTDVVPLITDAL